MHYHNDRTFLVIAQKLENAYENRLWIRNQRKNRPRIS